MTADQQASTLSHSSQVLAAMRGGQNDLAAQLAEQRATAAENAGMPQQAQAARQLAAQIKTDPQGAQAGAQTFKQQSADISPAHLSGSTAAVKVALGCNAGANPIKRAVLSQQSGG